MNTMAFQRDNHYVPCLYLKRFAASPGRVLTYRILVAHSRVPLWKSAAIKGIAYHAHLYTRIAAGTETMKSRGGSMPSLRPPQKKRL
jgi:hypothetical protein